MTCPDSPATIAEITDSVIRHSNRLEPIGSLAERLGPICPLCGELTTYRIVLQDRTVRMSERVCLPCETVTARRFGPKVRAWIDARTEGGYVVARLLRGTPGALGRSVIRRELFAPIAVEEGRGDLGAWIHGVLGQLAALFTLPELHR